MMGRKKEITLREHLKNISREGGLSKSKKKIESSKNNLKKALHARFPYDPRWN